MSPFGRLNSTHAEKMKKLKQYCREMEERCEQINTLRDDKIAQLPKLPEIQRIRPIQLILDSLREKNNKLELQLKNVSALRTSINALISQIGNSNSDEELGSVSPSSQLECKSSSASERPTNIRIMQKKLEWKQEMRKALASLPKVSVCSREEKASKYKESTLTKTETLGLALDKLGVKSKSKSKKYKTSIPNKKQPEAKKRNEAPLPRNDSANSNPKLCAEIKADRVESEVPILERPRKFSSIDSQLLDSNQNEPEWPTPVCDGTAGEEKKMTQPKDVPSHRYQWFEDELRRRAKTVKSKRKL